jgi:hypothetical protein
MFDDRFDDVLGDSAREYNDPPETPREEMWAAIQAKRTEKTEAAGIPVTPLRPLRHLRPWRWPAGIAAVLAIGVGLGRLSVHKVPSAAPPAVVASATPRVNAAAYHLVTTEHLGQSEAFLTLFRASVRQDTGNERLASATARQLLATNRLLLDSPAASRCPNQAPAAGSGAGACRDRAALTPAEVA